VSPLLPMPKAWPGFDLPRGRRIGGSSPQQQGPARTARRSPQDARILPTHSASWLQAKMQRIELWIVTAADFLDPSVEGFSARRPESPTFPEVLDYHLALVSFQQLARETEIWPSHAHVTSAVRAGRFAQARLRFVSITAQQCDQAQAPIPYPILPLQRHRLRKPLIEMHREPAGFQGLTGSLTPRRKKTDYQAHRHRKAANAMPKLHRSRLSDTNESAGPWVRAAPLHPGLRRIACRTPVMSGVFLGTIPSRRPYLESRHEPSEVPYSPIPIAAITRYVYRRR
jgi:hypothetical protein